MLNLPDNWLALTSGSVAVHLISRASDERLQTQVARFLISASLDLLQRAYAKKGTSFVSTMAVAELEWHVGDFRFVYVPVVNDDVLYHWVNLANAYRRNVNLIAPPRYGRLLFHALRSLPGRIAPTVMGIDEYVNLRTLFATIDFNWPRDRAHIELIEAYNRCVIESHGDSSICVELPETPDCEQRR